MCTIRGLRVLLLAVLAGLLAGSFAPAEEKSWWQKEEEERRSKQAFDRLVDSIGPNHPLAGKDLFAVLWYSPSTGTCGAAHGWITLSSAQRMGHINCRAPDARPVVWVKNGYCALAVGARGVYAAGYAATPEQARQAALRECGKRTTDGRIVACLYSGRNRPDSPMDGGDPMTVPKRVRR